MDQASSLRDLTALGFREEDQESLQSQRESGGNIYLITSGKGGVGKSLFAANLAAAIGTHDRPTLLIDGDSHRAHLSIMLGLAPRFSFGNVINRDLGIMEAIDDSLGAIHLLSGGDQMTTKGNYNHELRRILRDNLKRLSSIYSLIIIDGGSSVLENLVVLSRHVTSMILLTTPEVTSITDTYALIKYLMLEKTYGNIQVLVNMAQSAEQGREISNRINLMTAHYLNVEAPYAGCLLREERFLESVYNQEPAVLGTEGENVRKAIIQIANNIQMNIGLRTGEGRELGMPDDKNVSQMMESK